MLLLQMGNCWIGQRMIRVVSSMLCTVLVILIAQSSMFLFYFITILSSLLSITYFLTWFYTECFGMKVFRKRDVPKEKYSNAYSIYSLVFY